MKLSTVIGTAVLLSAGLVSGAAFAMDCGAAWTMASPNGDTISKGATVPYVIDYSMVDSDADGNISAEEFKKGCEAGAIKDANDATTKDMEGK
jgi:hypothetical protein